MALNPEVRLKWLTADEVNGPYLPTISSIWTGADEGRVREILPRQTAVEGFRLVAAESGAGRLEGFAYGFLGSPGQWWRDAVAAAMDGEARRRWLAPGHFEVTELHVHPDSRRRGVGGSLLDALLDGLTSPTAVLTTQTDNEPALALYGGRGWRVLIPRLFFPTAPDRPFCVMGRDLR